MQPGLVSVMMPAYNAAGYVAEAVRSVLAQTYQDWELLVVNDGSTDDTAAVVAGFTDSRIRLLNKANGGESSARNVALDHSRGEFIAYLDADDAYLPQHLAVTVEFLRANPRHGAVYTDGFHIDESGRRLASLQSRRRGPFEGRIFEEVVRASDVFGPPMCVVLRHEIVVRGGLRYDERIVIGPDWDFFVRVADLASFGYIQEATGLYRVHRSNITAQVGRTRRADYLALCRENAIRMASFGECSPETRRAVFYDLLVTLLRGQPERRHAMAASPQFAALPLTDQGRLLRLMSTEAILRDDDLSHVGEWLRRARASDPSDARTTVLKIAYGVSPGLCRALVRSLAPFRAGAPETAPFADLVQPTAEPAADR